MWSLPPFPFGIFLVAAEGASSAMPDWLWAVGAAVGSFLVTLLSGKIVVPTFAYNREKERADFWQAEALRLGVQLAEKTYEALSEASGSLRESSEVVKQAIAVIGRRRS